MAFKSYVIANTKTGLQPSKEFPKDIAGKSFTFGARASTSGRLMPEFFLRQQFDGKEDAGKGVVVGVLDTGYSPGNPFFAGDLVVGVIK